MYKRKRPEIKHHRLPYDVVPVGSELFPVSQLETPPSQAFLHFLGERMLSGETLKSILQTANMSPVFFALWKQKHPAITRFMQTMRSTRADFTHEEFTQTEIDSLASTLAKDESKLHYEKVRLKQTILSQHKKEESPEDFHLPDDKQNVQITVALNTQDYDRFDKTFSPNEDFLKDFGESSQKLGRKSEDSMTSFPPKTVEVESRDASTDV